MKNPNTREGYRVVVEASDNGEVALNLIKSGAYPANRYCMLSSDDAKRTAYALLLAADKIAP